MATTIGFILAFCLKGARCKRTSDATAVRRGKPDRHGAARGGPPGPRVSLRHTGVAEPCTCLQLVAAQRIDLLLCVARAAGRAESAPIAEPTERCGTVKTSCIMIVMMIDCVDGDR